jgi:hypothetical protein
LIPVLYNNVTTDTCTVSLDNGAGQPPISNTYMADETDQNSTAMKSPPPASITITGSQLLTQIKAIEIDTLNMSAIVVTQKGWHTITVKTPEQQELLPLVVFLFMIMSCFVKQSLPLISQGI